MSNAANRAHPHRTYAQAFRQQVIRETLAPDMPVSIVARRHDINANVVSGWRKQYRQDTLNRVDPDGSRVFVDMLRTPHSIDRSHSSESVALHADTAPPV
ncbi:transposase [Burkholderia cepacia]|uniref:Transposase n=1 Tax=Burkholderia cepacia TaxID=292 RepID=A0A8I1AIL1_BURCE|nr:transposase [Burkholderia cepacia]MBA9900749.1 transposase [Burkholderia cepacia]MBA9947718.1 transposase [Burkholderia cepacia]MBA9977904.1 transposase [Burkholderia cepacia]MBA9996751.1 transposase [Burkholderia cepacia]MBB0004565.1 transposase [Burkholderia cepacia]